MVISGSVAVQFFTGAKYPGCDLDIYVYQTHALLVGMWLESMNYRLTENGTAVRCVDSLLWAEHRLYDHLRGIRNVFTFVQSFTGTKVQLIIVSKSIVEVILSFHSSKSITSPSDNCTDEGSSCAEFHRLLRWCLLLPTIDPGR